jgi:hypothetical protein
MRSCGRRRVSAKRAGVFTGKKIGPRGSNPVGPTQSEKREARKRYADFTGHRSTAGRTVNLPTPRAALKVGTLDGVLYTTVRDGREESYIHKFRKRSRPTLAVGSNGKSLHVLGGEFEFTDRGIEDR